MAEVVTNLDIFTSFAVHPDTNQLLFKSNERAIAQSIRNLILTNQYERPFQPNVGGNISALLFEIFSPQTTLELESNIKEVIKNNEPRAIIDQVIVVPSISQNSYDVNIYYYVDLLQNVQNVHITLSRLR